MRYIRCSELNPDNSITPQPQSWTLAYDNRDRLVSATANTSGGATTFSYAYDANGNRTASSSGASSSLDLLAEFSAFGQTRTTTRAHTIAPDSNRSTARSQTAVLKQGSSVLSSVASTTSYAFDSAGNPLGDGLRTFQYDAENRHSKTVVSDIDEGSKETYLLNALGQRVFKSDAQVDHTAPNEAVLGSAFINWLRTNFGWLFSVNNTPAQLGTLFNYADGPLPPWALLSESTNGSNSSTTVGPMEYIWLPVDGGGPGGGAQLVALRAQGGRMYSVHTDHLGTPRQVRYSSYIPIMWQLPFSPFGETPPSGALQTVTQTVNGATSTRFKATAPFLTLNLRFPGQYFDQKSNLNYNLMRSYCPECGRYTQPDPIGLEGGWNRFGYVGGNALRYSDPRGLWEVSVEFYGPIGGGISFGRDPNTGQGFLSCKVGIGLGGGVTFDPLGGRPGGDRAEAGRGGATLGISVDAGGTLGIPGFGISGQLSGSRGYDFGNSRQYNDPSIKGNIGTSPGSKSGGSIGGSIGIQGSIYDAGRR